MQETSYKSADHDIMFKIKCLTKYDDDILVRFSVHIFSLKKSKSVVIVKNRFYGTLL